MTKRLGVSSKIYMVFVYMFLYMPIFYLIVFSFNSTKSSSVFSGFSTQWYTRLFQNDELFSALITTLVVAVISSVIATIIGTLAAVGMSGMSKWGRSAVMSVTYVPVVNPEIVTGVSMMLLFVGIRTVLGDLFNMGFGTLIIAHITFNVPYIIFSVSPKLRQMDKNLYDAALDLGCSPAQAFFKVVLPEIMPGVTTGFLMALTYSIDDFVISFFTAGTVQTLPIAVYSMTRRIISPEVNALSTILFVTVLCILLIMNIRDVRTERNNNIARNRV